MRVQETLWFMHKASRPVINPQWVMLGVLGRGGGGGVIKGPQSHWGGSSHPTINSWTFDPWLSFNCLSTHPLPCTFLSNENTDMSQQYQDRTNANMAFAKHHTATPPVTVHLRQKGGYTGKSDSQLYGYCSYHDIVALHLRLFVGQFIVLHFKTSEWEGGKRQWFIYKSSLTTYLGKIIFHLNLSVWQ